MSEFTNHKEERVAAFADFTKRLIAGAKGRELMEEYRFLFHTLVPDDIITAVDRLFQMEIPLEDLKVGLNKMLNLFQIRIKEYPALKPEKDSFLDLLNRNNAALKERLAVLRPKNTQINRDPSDEALRKELLEGFREVEQFVKMYEIKENVLFPALEKHWDDWRCAQVMWSYHDDIRVELKGLIAELEKETFDVKAFNKFLGDSYYNMHTIIFRDDYILIPVMLERMSAEVLAELTRESRDQEFPFVKPARKKPSQTEGKHPDRSLPVDLGTGVVTPEQIALMFNHLPVDITYVDENDEVRYFSSPKKRVFHRSISIIGRKVQNCHPPDSVHIVEKIVEAFRKGEKDEASFWIRMRDDYLLIRYFAVRDAEGKFRGVLEVTQEIGEIQKIEGEKRLLDWNDD